MAAAEVGQGEFRYRARDDWARVPEGFRMGEVAGVAVDSADRVYVFNRSEHPVMVFSPEGAFLRSWGAGVFQRPHGISITPEDVVYCTDDDGQVVHAFTPEGNLLHTLGVRGRASDTGATGDFRTIRHSGPPFNVPTNVAFAPNGDVYVTDGYRNARVHHFSAAGELRRSWGEPGTGPGQFRIPHGIVIDPAGRIYVADRENSRIQLFDLQGSFLGEWTGIARPCQAALDAAGRVFVAELGYRAGMWPGTEPPAPGATGGRVSVFGRDGALLARWGGGEDPKQPGDFFAPHDLCIDSRGDLYVGEVTLSAGGSRGLVSPDCPSLQKFERIRS